LLLNRGFGMLELLLIALFIGMLFYGVTIQGHGLVWDHNNISWH
jgi:hypothetical protein